MNDRDLADHQRHIPETNELAGEPADIETDAEAVALEAEGGTRKRRRTMSRRAAEDAPRADFDPTWDGREPGEVM
jgi:hypothetical protein